MEKTAVEWLVEELEIIENYYHSDSTDYVDSKKNVIELAEIMEKQQIVDSYIECKRQYIVEESCFPPQFVVKEAEQYYNKTYKNK